MKYFKILIIMIAGILIYSCSEDSDFLNPDPESAISGTTFFENDAQVVQGIIGVYDAIQGTNESIETNDLRANRGVQFEYLLTEHRSDNTRSATLEGSRADFHRYLVEVNNSQSADYYQSMYEIIFRANNVLENVDGADESNIARYSGELRFLRAYAYLNLVRLYGGVPVVTNTIPPSDESAFIRASVDEVYAQIVSDLENATQTLDVDGPPARATRGSAQALLALALMSQPNRDYLGAQQLLESVINSGQYTLLQNYNDIFYSEGNDELLFVVEFSSTESTNSQGFSAEFTTTDGRQDGLNITEDNLVQDITVNGGNRTATLNLFTDNFNASQKFLPDNARFSGNDWIVLRYADVLLLHAESIIADAQFTESAAALASVNAVRARAGVEPLEDRLLLSDLLLERRVELAHENKRFFDLQRKNLATQIYGPLSDELGYSFTPNQLLLPIPAREINQSNGLLTQNPGY